MNPELKEISEEEMIASLEASEHLLPEAKLPSRGWIAENFKSRSAAIRYLHLERKASVKEIAGLLDLKYRHVFNVVSKTKKQVVPDHVCPVCMNRKAPEKKG